MTQTRRYFDGGYHFGTDRGVIVGQSAPMLDLFGLIDLLAEKPTTVLIQGESGTGKELVAGALHFNADQRSMNAFVPVNCAGLPESLLESILFGHVKGAFTGAHESHQGMARMADRGTLFLDEIGDMSLYLQAKILRLLQNGEVVPVGSNVATHVDLRVIAATHRDLQAMVEQGAFREDLFYRLNVFPLRVPPLRQRREDIPLIIEFLIKEKNRNYHATIAGVENDAMEWLKDQEWKGNVRELDALLERCFVRYDRGWITLSHLTENGLNSFPFRGESERRRYGTRGTWYEHGVLPVTVGEIGAVPGAHRGPRAKKLVDGGVAYAQRVGYQGASHWLSLVLLTRENARMFFRDASKGGYSQMLSQIDACPLNPFLGSPFKFYSIQEILGHLNEPSNEGTEGRIIAPCPYFKRVKNTTIVAVTETAARGIFEGRDKLSELRIFLEDIGITFQNFREYRPK